jgi:hypothetical protein
VEGATANAKELLVAKFKKLKGHPVVGAVKS